MSECLRPKAEMLAAGPRRPFDADRFQWIEQCDRPERFSGFQKCRQARQFVEDWAAVLPPGQEIVGRGEVPTRVCKEALVAIETIGHVDGVE